jgi:hypothetical protein
MEKENVFYHEIKEIPVSKKQKTIAVAIGMLVSYILTSQWLLFGVLMYYSALKQAGVSLLFVMVITIFVGTGFLFLLRLVPQKLFQICDSLKRLFEWGFLGVYILVILVFVYRLFFTDMLDEMSLAYLIRW